MIEWMEQDQEEEEEDEAAAPSWSAIIDALRAHSPMVSGHRPGMTIGQAKPK